MLLADKEASVAGLTSAPIDGKFGDNCAVRGARSSSAAIMSLGTQDMLEVAGDVGFLQNNGQANVCFCPKRKVTWL